MTPAIVVVIFFAVAAGLATGFRTRWKKSFLASSLAVPALASFTFAVRLEPFVVLWGWALMTFVWSFLAASIVWGIAAGAHHLLSLLFSKVRGGSRSG